ncbi:hypothetical protein CXB51_004498 [Gossypium anomalum]|uniref:Integrase catalytic domain-containing protein n=1 Tax=Gossypium anomalum TaxID=47600 RepID=A0A8J5ZG45_9ROSI|nr:hypothetical protein CXB51_004498 [Gossypium anomalum]
MDLEDALLGIDKMPSTLTDEEKKRKDRKALTQLHLYLSNEILQDVMKEKSTAALWKRLEQICMSKTLTSKLHMKQHLYAHRLEEGVSVQEHLIAFKEIFSNLEAMEVQYDKEDLGLILLCSSPPSYSTFRDTILYSRESLTVDENVDDDRERTQERNPRGKSKGRSKYSNRDKTCNFCCTFHMSPNQDWFTTYETMFEGVILMGNNASCKIADVGTIKVKMFDGVVRTLSDVRHVPELKKNLISLSTLDSKRYKYTTESRVLKISKGSLVVIKEKKKTAKLYVLQGSTVIGNVVVTSSSLSDDDITKLWHMHLGHMSENDMSELSKRGLLDDGKTNKILRTDNGLEFSSDEFNRLCKLEGIVRHLTIGHTPQQNGVAERMNRSTDLHLLPLRKRHHKRTRREIKPPKKYTEADLVAYALNVAEYIDANQEPSNYSEAKKGTLGVEEPRYKVRLVAKGYSQIPRVDFTDVFSPVVKHSLIRALLGIVAIHDLELEQLDVKTVFLYGKLEEDIYM